MNIVVCVKRVPATDTRVKVAGDGASIDTSQVEWIISPYDEYALEAALQVKDAEPDTRVTVVCFGPEQATKELRTCLAMGADEAVHVKQADAAARPAQTTAAVLAAALRDLEADLVLCGKQAVDLDQGQVGALLAHHLGLPCVTEVKTIELADGKALCERAGEEGTTERYEVSLPALLTFTKGDKDPRYASLKGIMQAKKKPIDAVEPTEPEGGVVVRSLDLPAERSGGRIVGEGAEAVPELVRLLREEAKVL